MNGRALTWLAALSGAASLVIWKAGDVLSALFTPEVATIIVSYTLEGTVMFLMGVGAIVVGWTTTFLFKSLALEPDPIYGWKPHTRRMMACSFVWTTVTLFAMLTLRYLHNAPVRLVVERLLYIGVGVLGVGGFSILAFDVVVKRAWPRLLRHFFPSKFVQTPEGVVERDSDMPSDPTTERTIFQPPDKPE